MIDNFKVLNPSKPDALSGVRSALVDRPAPLPTRETIQIVLIREVQDYTVLRTEETRELNTVWTPATANGSGEMERVAFLATKQKAAESRELEALLRTWNANVGRSVAKECYLKSSLCLSCPRCVLFGATDVSKGEGKGANIKHRIAYGTAFSLLPVDPNLRETHTFNGVDSATQLTGQTLGDRESVRPGSLFASIVTLRSATEMELVLVLKTLLACTRYGAESRIGGIVRNHVVGLVAAQEEICSPLELALGVTSGSQSGNQIGTPSVPSRTDVATLLDTFKRCCSSPGSASVLTEDELNVLMSAVQAVSLSREQLDEAYKAAEDFRGSQSRYLKKAKGKD